MTYTTQQIRKMSDQEVYEALTSDFLQRDGNTFVRIRRTDRLGWEETLPKGSAYSERMLSPKNTEELLKSAYAHASDMIKAMNTPYPVTVNVSGSTSYTDSRVVFVASDMLDDKSMSIGQRLDVFTGYAVHEGSHLLYTDWNYCRKNPHKTELVRFLRNILVDEMIEIKLGEDKPGLANFLSAAKYHAFGRYLNEKNAKQKADTDAITEIINAFLKLVRYPKALTPDLILKHGRLLLEMREVLNPYPDSTKKVAAAADKIYEILIREYQQEMQQESESESEQNGQGNSDSESQENDQKSKEDNGSGESSQQQSGNKSQNQQDSEENTKKQDGQPSSGSDKSNNSSGQKNASGSKTVSEEEARKRLEEDFNKIKQEVEKLASEPKSNLDEKDQAKGFKDNNKELALECEGKLERGKTNNTVLFKAEPNLSVYEQSLRRVKRFIPAVSRALKCNGTEFKTTLRGMRSGYMDPCKIAEAYQGVPSVYMRDNEVKADKMTVALLVDESGSMEIKKMQAARDTAILFSEALKNVPNISLYIYGYTSRSRKTMIYKYQEPGYKVKGALGSMIARGTTPTREAIAETVSRIKADRNEKKLLIVISDGDPDSSHEKVALEVQAAEKAGIKVMGISIDDDLPERILKLMYGNYIKFSDMNSLVISLGRVLKKEVLESTKKRYSA